MTTQLRVLWLIKGLGLGGAEALVASCTPRFDRTRFDLHVAYTLPHKAHRVGALETAGIPVHLLGDGRRARWPVALTRLLRDQPFDIVHSHSPLPAVVARAVRRPGTQLVYTEHNMWQRYRLATRMSNAATYRREDHVFAVSSMVAESTHQRRAVEVLHHGVDADAFAAADPTARHLARRTLGIPDGAMVIGTVGNLTPKKDHATLLRAFAGVRQAIPDAVLAIIGGGPLEDDLRRLAATLHISDAVQLLGSRDDVPDVLAAFDIFALTSRHEGLPLALLEAYAAGVPVVSTPVGGVPEILTDGREGVLVPVGDPQALTVVLLELLGDPARRLALAAHGRRAVLRFNPDAAVRRMEQLYLQLSRSRQPA